MKTLLMNTWNGVVFAFRQMVGMLGHNNFRDTVVDVMTEESQIFLAAVFGR